MEPDLAAVGGDHAEVLRGGLEVDVAVADDLVEQGPVLGMDDALPEVRIGHPPRRRVPEHALDLRAHVEDVPHAVALGGGDGLEVGDGRDLLDEDPVPVLGRTQLVLGPPPVHGGAEHARGRSQRVDLGVGPQPVRRAVVEADQPPPLPSYEDRERRQRPDVLRLQQRPFALRERPHGTRDALAPLHRLGPPPESGLRPRRRLQRLGSRSAARCPVPTTRSPAASRAARGRPPRSRTRTSARPRPRCRGARGPPPPPDASRRRAGTVRRRTPPPRGSRRGGGPPPVARARSRPPVPNLSVQWGRRTKASRGRPDHGYRRPGTPVESRAWLRRCRARRRGSPTRAGCPRWATARGTWRRA